MIHLMFVVLIENVIVSSLIFCLLVLRARIKTAFMYRDNLLIIVASSVLAYTMLNTVLSDNKLMVIVVNPIIVMVFILLLTLFRFYRNPERKCSATEKDLLAPADGFVSYIRRIDSDKIPISIKGKDISKLSELSKVDVIKTPCWLVGITMTLFDVHYVRSPVRGEIVLNQYTRGKFLSLKNASSEVENERNTVVIEDNQRQIGVVEIASKRVRGIRSYIKTGQRVEMGQRIGKITFGSQVDVIFPTDATPTVKNGEWVYGGKTIIAVYDVERNHNEYNM